MEGIGRKPFQGIKNIIRFNWHYYVIAFSAIIVLLFTRNTGSLYLSIAATVFIILITLSITISLAVSWYIYDHSQLYSLSWLDRLHIGTGKRFANFNAGFDETSSLLKAKFSDAILLVYDFYDPARHTEISIERARKAYPPFPGTQEISTNNIPLLPGSVDYIFLLFAAHEIRNDTERVVFFKALNDILTENGKIIIAEHQRDINNFIAYNIGFFHFYSKKKWQRTFSEARLSIDSVLKITPFITVSVLKKNGTIS